MAVGSGTSISRVGDVGKAVRARLVCCRRRHGCEATAHVQSRRDLSCRSCRQLLLMPVHTWSARQAAGLSPPHPPALSGAWPAGRSMRREGEEQTSVQASSTAVERTSVAPHPSISWRHAATRGACLPAVVRCLEGQACRDPPNCPPETGAAPRRPSPTCDPPAACRKKERIRPWAWIEEAGGAGRPSAACSQEGGGGWG